MYLSGVLHTEETEATYSPPRSVFDCYKTMLYVVVSPPAEPPPQFFFYHVPPPLRQKHIHKVQCSNNSQKQLLMLYQVENTLLHFLKIKRQPACSMLISNQMRTSLNSSAKLFGYL